MVCEIRHRPPVADLVFVSLAPSIENQSTDLTAVVFGAHAKFDLSARIVRSEVATVNGLGVTYYTAVAFSEERDLLTMLGAVPAEVIAPQPSVPDLLVQVTTELYEKDNYDAARSAFDGFLRQIAPGCTVRLVESPGQPQEGCESITSRYRRRRARFSRRRSIRVTSLQSKTSRSCEHQRQSRPCSFSTKAAVHSPSPPDRIEVLPER